MFYFAYGSNMDKEDLDKWCENRRLPKIEFLSISPAKLNGYKLCFNYFSSSRNAGAANIMESRNDCVYGLLLEIKDSDIEVIRRKEGYSRDPSKCYYDEISVNVEKFDGALIRNVKIYKVVKHREKPEHQLPTRYYMQLIIRNAKKYNFPKDYIQFLKSIKTI
ncbi:MAG TPA: hypothetical protein DHV62_04475 [Elusimicrobia bacterium]|jgi:hypothetical protein|nr:hypothetical protein [Elusimicrobiota bacterium]